MTAKPPTDRGEQSTPIPDTKRQPTGSINRAEQFRGDAVKLADRLEARAVELAMEAGRPDLQLRRIARRLRDVAKRCECWHTPPPGSAARTSPIERAQDYADVETWFTEATTALEATAKKP